MAGTLALSGHIVIGGDDCSCDGSADNLVKAIGDGCDESYQTCVDTPKPIQIATLAGVFIDLPILQTLTRIEFLFLRSASEITIRIGAAPATLVGVGATFPTGFVGAETLELAIDGAASVTTTFLVGDQTAQQVADRVNSALALAGIATPRMTVNLTTGQLEVTGILTGSSQGSVEVVVGGAEATLGLAVGTVVGAGADVTSNGVFLNEFPRNTNAPARVQVSGTSSISLVAGGRTDGL